VSSRPFHFSVGWGSLILTERGAKRIQIFAILWPAIVHKTSVRTPAFWVSVLVLMAM
jgi:hypothetical protein